MAENKTRRLPVLLETRSFCALPWVHLCASVDGVWSRCCVDQTMYYDDYYKMDEKPEFKLSDDAIGCLPLSPYSTANPEKSFNLLEAFNSLTMKGTRLSMLAGEEVAACRYCYDKEDHGGTSYRKIANHMFKDRIDSDNLIGRTSVDGSLDVFPCYLDIRFGNACNLACVMCGFPVSSRWGQKSRPKWIQANIDPYDSDDELWRILQENASNLSRVYFAGGEPFLQPLHFKFLDLLIESNCAGQIDLGYNTNLTVLPKGLFEKLVKFKSVDIGASCDGTEDVFESIRVGGKWSTFVENVRETKKHFPVRLAVTTQKGNIANLEQLIQWAIDEKCEIDLTNILLHPQELCISNLRHAERRVFADKYRALSLHYCQQGYPKIAEDLAGVISFLDVG